MNTGMARSVFALGLKNAHAMEKQALAIMRPQVNRLQHYPDLAQRLRSHISETEIQIDRLGQTLDAMGEHSSAMQDSFMSAFGTMASIGNVAAGDEVLKHSFANLAFENYEIGAYSSLIAAARIFGESDAIPLLEQSLEEERRMATWVAGNIPSITETFILRNAVGEKAKV